MSRHVTAGSEAQLDAPARTGAAVPIADTACNSSTHVTPVPKYSTHTVFYQSFFTTMQAPQGLQQGGIGCTKEMFYRNVPPSLWKPLQDGCHCLQMPWAAKKALQPVKHSAPEVPWEGQCI